jgi:hypothetical protein
MCEKKPGPRCNDGCKIRAKKLAAYKKVSSYSKNSQEYLSASLELVEAQSIYDSTPKGISELEAKLSSEPTTLLAKRLFIGKTTRAMQYAALDEHKNGRQEIVANLVSRIYSHYSPEEIHTIIDGTRENYEQVVINSHASKILTSDPDFQKLEESIFKKSKETYNDFLNRLEGTVDSEYLDKLKEMAPPYDYIVNIYSSAGMAVKKADEQMGRLFKSISVLQDSEPNTVKKYFNLYKKEFIEKYSSLSKEAQPTPPREWVEGFISGNGITRNENTMLIPRLPETQYAIYKLIVDYSAIPDYEKSASKITFVDFINGEITVKELTRTGKSIQNQTSDQLKFIDYLKTNKINNTFISASPEVSNIIRQQDLPMLFIPDVTKIMFDLPSHDAEGLHNFFNTKDSQELYSMVKKKALKTWNTKPSRVSAKK